MQILTPERKRFLMEQLKQNLESQIHAHTANSASPFSGPYRKGYLNGFKCCLALLETLDAEPADYVNNPIP